MTIIKNLKIFNKNTDNFDEKKEERNHLLKSSV